MKVRKVWTQQKKTDAGITSLPASHVTLILRWRSWAGYEWWDSLVDPLFDIVVGNAVVCPVVPSPPFDMESNGRLLYVGSSVVDGNRLNDGRTLPSPLSDSEEVDEERASTTEKEGRRCRIGGIEEVMGSGVGIMGSLALER